MSLDELLHQCRENHLILLTNKRGQAALYAPNVEVSRQIRAAIRQHNRQLVQMIRAADARVCVNPRLHACMWDTCFICQKLDAAIAPTQRRQRVA
jgi:hypothetical protein